MMEKSESVPVMVTVPSKEMLAVIDKAAELDNRTRSNFMVYHAYQAAKKVGLKVERNAKQS